MTGQGASSIGSSSASSASSATMFRSNQDVYGEGSQAPRFVRAENTAGGSRPVDTAVVLRDAAQRVRDLRGQSSQMQVAALLELSRTTASIPAARDAIGALLGGQLHVPGALDHLAAELDQLSRVEVPPADSAPTVTSLTEKPLYGLHIRRYFLSDPNPTLAGAKAVATANGTKLPNSVVTKAMQHLTFGTSSDFKDGLLRIVKDAAQDVVRSPQWQKHLKKTIDHDLNHPLYNFEAVYALVMAAVHHAAAGGDLRALTLENLQTKVDRSSRQLVDVLLHKPQGYVAEINPENTGWDEHPDLDVYEWTKKYLTQNPSAPLEDIHAAAGRSDVAHRLASLLEPLDVYVANARYNTGSEHREPAETPTDGASPVTPAFPSAASVPPSGLKRSAPDSESETSPLPKRPHVDVSEEAPVFVMPTASRETAIPDRHTPPMSFESSRFQSLPSSDDALQLNLPPDPNADEFDPDVWYARHVTFDASSGATSAPVLHDDRFDFLNDLAPAPTVGTGSDSAALPFPAVQPPWTQTPNQPIPGAPVFAVEDPAGVQSQR